MKQMHYATNSAIVYASNIELWKSYQLTSLYLQSLQSRELYLELVHYFVREGEKKVYRRHNGKFTL